MVFCGITMVIPFTITIPRIGRDDHVYHGFTITVTYQTLDRDLSVLYRGGGVRSIPGYRKSKPPGGLNLSRGKRLRFASGGA